MERKSTIYQIKNFHHYAIKKTLLFSDGEPWVKKGDKDDFDVPMGCYDRAEVGELIGTYLLNQGKVAIAKENMGLYIDDGLGIFKNMSRP